MLQVSSKLNWEVNKKLYQLHNLTYLLEIKCIKISLLINQETHQLQHRLLALKKVHYNVLHLHRLNQLQMQIWLTITNLNLLMESQFHKTYLQDLERRSNSLLHYQLVRSMFGYTFLQEGLLFILDMGDNQTTVIKTINFGDILHLLHMDLKSEVSLP